VIVTAQQRSSTARIERLRLLQTAAALGISAIIVFLYLDVVTGMARDWWVEPSLSQGLLIPPLALYLAWQRRGQILGEMAKPDGWGLWAVALACLLFMVGKLAAEFFVWRISLVVLLAGLMWTFWGWRRLRRAAFELLLLATMVPLPNLVYSSLSTPLQLFASDVSTTIAQLAGTVAYHDGNIIYLANTTLGIEEACSGLNSLSALMVASVLLSFSTCSHWATRIALFLMAFPVSVAMNVARVAGTAILADRNQEFAEGFYHLFSGWLVFVFGFVVLYLTARTLNLTTRKQVAG
jgi:exosortase